MEVGSVMFGKYDKQGTLIPANQELVRLAIPRRVYTQSHVDYVIEALEKNWSDRKPVRGYDITFENPSLRHFTAGFKPLKTQTA